MRSYHILILLCHILLLVSCSTAPVEVVEPLRQAERCMETRPDSALILLNQLPNPNALTGKERADYALLMTQAKDKNYMDLSLDSSIVFAVDYFKKRDNNPPYGKALYYYGRVIQATGDDARAMKLFLEAKQVLEKTEEYKTIPCGDKFPKD